MNRKPSLDQYNWDLLDAFVPFILLWASFGIRVFTFQFVRKFFLHLIIQIDRTAI